VYNDLPQTKRTAFDNMKAAAPKGTKVVLVEGVHDTGVTWKEVFGTGKRGDVRAKALESILVGEREDGGAGVSSAEADRLIQWLLNSRDTLKVVIGTDPVRGAYDYRKGITGDDIAHHFDPLYLGGGHKLIAFFPRKRTTPYTDSSMSYGFHPVPIRPVFDCNRTSYKGRCAIRRKPRWSSSIPPTAP
jgi:hypothetical protein